MGTTASRPCISTIVLRAICGFSGIAVPQNMPAAFAGEGEIHGHCEHIWLPEGAHTVLGDGIELL